MSVIGSALPFFFGASTSSAPVIGAAYQGGFFAGYISQTANSVATHALIVAPSASGYNGQVTLQWKTLNTTSVGTTSLYDGAANSANMNDASHLAAQYCEGLSIGGYSDWYLPARDELEIAYYNLKPNTTSNNTSFGTNAYSVPSRGSNYTAGTPAQTIATAFQTGNSEAFRTNDNHWSSTEADFKNAWRLIFSTGEQQNTDGGFNFGNKNSAAFVRAFRKVAL